MNNNLQTATLAGGCFWCLEAVFDQVKGVSHVPYVFEKGKRLQITYGPMTGLEQYMIGTRQMFLCNEHVAEQTQELFGGLTVVVGEVPAAG